jgi:hypothetical protein
MKTIVRKKNKPTSSALKAKFNRESDPRKELMKKRIFTIVPFVAIFALFISLRFCSIGGKDTSSSKNMDDAFYVWQRDWNENVIDAVKNEAHDIRFYLLSREIGTNIVRITPNWGALQNRKYPPVPVFRIHYESNWLEKNPDAKRRLILEEFKTVKNEFALAKIAIKELQLDLDCPERLLTNYCEFIRELRKDLPDIKFSITVLPCYLNEKSFPELIALLDEYVLQIHGLECPKKLGDKMYVMDLALSLKAMSQAESIGRAFRVAIPSYGYEMIFNSNTGQFTGLAAENHPPLRADMKSHYITVDLNDLKIVREKAWKMKHCNGLIWFRLPVRGDRLCFDRKILREIQNGKVPSTALSVEWKLTEKENITELYIRNEGVLGKKYAEIHLNWGENNYCEYGIYPGGMNVSAYPIPGVLPEKIRSHLPLSGESIPIAWFNSKNINPDLKIILLSP